MKIQLPGEKIKHVLYAPHVSEKSTKMLERNQYVFHVAKDADKNLVRRAVEKHYDVKVESVNLINVRGKAKTTARRRGRRGDWKKACVTLEAGSTITTTGSD